MAVGFAPIFWSIFLSCFSLSILFLLQCQLKNNSETLKQFYEEFFVFWPALNKTLNKVVHLFFFGADSGL